MKKLGLLYICTLSLLISAITPIKGTVSKPHVAAESAILLEADTGQILYDKLSERQLSPASITKLMTALLALESLSPNEEVTFSRTAVLSIERGSSHIGIRENEILTVDDALHGLMLESANEVANGLAEEVSGSIEAFVKRMNERADELGALNTNFVNPHGLYDEEQVTTAYDMSLIMKELLKHDYFLEIMSHPTHQIQPTNIVDEIRYLSQSHKMLNIKKGTTNYREDVIAGKSGYTIQSGHTLVTVGKSDDRTLIAVTLKTDADHLYSDTHSLLDYGFEGYDQVTLNDYNYSYISPIISGDKTLGNVTIAADPNISFLMPVGSTVDSISYNKDLPQSFDPSIAIGDVIGQVSLYIDDLYLASTDMIVSELDDGSSDILDGDVPVNDSSDTPDAEEPSDGFKIPIWPFVLLFVLVAIGLLYYFSQKNKMSYADYKKMRDAQNTSNEW